MSFLLHFTGPSSFEQTVALKPKTPAVVVGRDPEAAVYLPDTERLISRRHLSIEWSDGGARVRVLSANGINTDRGDYFSGDEVVLAEGESARIGSFSLIVSGEPESSLDATSFSGMGARPVPAGPVTRASPAGNSDDPWADLLSDHAPKPAPLPAEPPAAVAAAPQQPAAPAPMPSGNHDDPFSSSTSWRMVDVGDPFSASFVGRSGVDQPLPSAAPGVIRAGVPAAGPSPAGGQAEQMALKNLCRGLGVEMPGSLTGFDWERFGQSVRHVVQCLGDHLATRVDAKQSMRAEDRTMLGAKETNPLKASMPVKDMLQYLLFAADGVGGYTPANRALQEAAVEAKSHEAAARAAARGLAEGAIKEFDPAKLRGTLLKGKLSMSSLVDNARLWDLYTGFYDRKKEKLPDWGEQLFNRYYMAAYLRETEKLRRSRMPPPAQRTE
ncbi:type VI secretion system-associated FHA domain protein TagH [Ramlibacter humi]|uniref:type VI secretion system-associated FHA domain protein TagH n=1 Tax=Ramlibacter humi TaxID=2530451 RepID=UPI00142FE2CE|nr:type VI secretion system-associated FHA domain protein TagH [Ramlibacter humi]